MRARAVLRWIGRLALVGAVLLGVAAFVWRHRLAEVRWLLAESIERADELEQLGSVDGLAAWIQAHPDKVALVTFVVGPDGAPLADRPALWHRADEVMPVGSVAKIGVAAAWTLAVTDGGRDPEAPMPADAWDARWLPGTDGDAHDRSLAFLKRSVGAEGAVPESRLVGAMVRHSDNAAADWLSDTLGDPALAEVEALGLRHLGTVRHLAGTFLLWSEVPADTLLGWDDATEAEARGERARAWREAFDGTRRTPPALPPLRDQVRLAARFGPKGVAGDYARALAGVVAGTWPSPNAAVSLDRALSWPMLSEAAKERFERFGAKGGALPGVLTDAFYVQPKGDAHARVVVLFLQDLPASAWAAMLQSYVHQDFMLALVKDEARVTALAAGLGR